MSNIHIILTGGTIEKSYDPVTEKPEFRENSIVPDYLGNAVKAYPAISYEALCQIDSTQMTDAHRADIALSIAKTDSNKIVIIHGTSTMQDTARFLLHDAGCAGKTIVLTGAMIPMKEFAMSDGGFNLGYAMAQVQHLPEGIYVCMNARVFKADEVAKNISAGRFEVAL